VFPNTALGSTSTFRLVVGNAGTSQLIGTVNTPPKPFRLSGVRELQPGAIDFSPDYADVHADLGHNLK
jgi:hypothetical protein